MSNEDKPKKAAKKAAKKPAAKKPATKKAAAKPVEVESTTVEETKPVEKVVETMDTHDDHPPKPYLQVFIALFVLTIIEVALGNLETSTAKVAILLTLAVGKAAVVAAVFMHVKYDKNPLAIIVVAFIVPLIAAMILGFTVYADYR